MKREPFIVPTLKPRRSPQALAISIVLHVIGIAVLSMILVETRIGDWVGLPRGKSPPRERITYIDVAPAPGAVGADTGAAPAATPETPATPTARPMPTAPAETPRGVTPMQPVPAPDGVPGGRGGGGGGGGGAGGTGPGTGMVPSFSDSRVWAPPGTFSPVPKAPRQVVDSVIDVAVGAYLDSLQVAARTRGREPGDWTFGGDGDTKWGVDSKWIHFGKLKIPTALLAMLPINAQANPSFNARDRAAIRWDINYHAQRAITEDEFRQSVKRIRERAERARSAERNAARGGAIP